MERLKMFARWGAIVVGAVAVAVALMPHRQDTAPVPDDSPPPLVQAVAASPSPTAAPSASPALLAVYVCGAVRHAGVFRLAQGSRIVDAIDRAGGLTNDADEEAINLAQSLSDGVEVDVPRKGQPRLQGNAEDTGSRVPAVASHRIARGHSTGRGSSHKLQPGQWLDINTAGETDLTQLPGVGPSLARRIVEYRQANGPFATIDDIQNVSGVGASKFAKMAPYLRT